MTTQLKKRSYKKRKVRKVVIILEKGLVASVSAPKDVDVVIRDYDIKNWDFTDSELKTDASKRRYTEEVWEGEDA
jgi:hypothetical protein